MCSRLILALFLFGAWGIYYASGFAQEATEEATASFSAQRQKAWQLIKEARELILAGRFAEAEQKLLRAKELDPTYPEIYVNLGYLYNDRVWPNREKALEAYGQLLLLRPERQDAREQMRRLFYEEGKPFPRLIRAPYLAFSGVNFALEEVQIGSQRQGIAYTTSILFHEEMSREGEPVRVPLPATGNKAFCAVNRSCYGYILDAQSDRYLLRFILSWPSELLSGGRNYAPLSANLMSLMLRFYCYSRLYLGLPREASLIKAYLCRQGPAGAESYQQALYFYDIDTARDAFEWTRQAAHEMGHLVLPPIGRFVRPEPYAAGELGERLFIQYLAQEAEEVSGSPWPAPAAQKALAGLWRGENLPLAEYIEKVCRPSMDYWLAAGPHTDLLNAAEPDAEGMQYLIGFLLWIQAAHGPSMLRDVLHSASETAPAHYMRTYQELISRQSPKNAISIHAGSLNVKGSQLTKPPLEGPMGRRPVLISPKDSVFYYVYLPAGAWTLTLQPAIPKLVITIDGKGPVPCDEAGSVSLGQLPQAGWHTLLLQLPEDGEAKELEKLIFRQAPEA